MSKYFTRCYARLTQFEIKFPDDYHYFPIGYEKCAFFTQDCHSKTIANVGRGWDTKSGPNFPQVVLSQNRPKKGGHSTLPRVRTHITKILDLLSERGLLPEDAGFDLLDVYTQYRERVVKKSAFPNKRWPEDRRENETPENFLRSHWGTLIREQRVTRSDLLREDPGLYRAWFNWLRGREVPKDLVLPKKAENRDGKHFSRATPAKRDRMYRSAMELTNQMRRTSGRKSRSVARGGQTSHSPARSNG